MSRLAKGQVARSVRMRSEAVRASVLARLAALDSAIKADRVDARRAMHFASFDSFSHWHEPGIGITRLTPKTVRRHIDAVVAGGQPALLLRLRSAAALASGSKARKSRVVLPKREGAEPQLIDHLHHFSQRYLDLLERMKRLARTDDGARVGLANHLRLFGSDAPTLRRVK